MNDPSSQRDYQEWQRANQRYLMAAVAIVGNYLEQHSDRFEGTPPDKGRLQEAQQALATAADCLPAAATLDVLCRLFRLSAFERDVLLLCAGMDLDGRFAALCAAAQPDPQHAYPTFGLALAALPNPDWRIISLAAPLRYWHLIEVGEAQALTAAPLRIDPCILQFLIGVEYIDDRLTGLYTPAVDLTDLAPSHQGLVAQMVDIWTATSDTGIQPVLQLCGEDASKTAIALAVCEHLELELRAISAHSLPTDPASLATLMRRWERESALTDSLLLLDCDELDTSHPNPAVDHWLERTQGLLFITSRQRRTLAQRPLLSFDITKPPFQEQRLLWQQALGEETTMLNGHLDRLIYQFNLSAPVIRAACAGVRSQDWEDEDGEERAIALWEACRLQSRPRLDDLAQRIAPMATWEDLILPEAQRQVLREIAIHVRQRAIVYDTWGFASKSTRGLGTAALFAGSSGTGKTMAAEVLAQELRLDLYRIDLSAVVSKYIGETEKNLRRVFDAAETGGAILLFDEADALFGKRSEVKDSHDRHANIEVSYLLQRVEAYRGLAILTTNLPNALDDAFMRRLRFIVQFPFPDVEQRVLIWQRIFPTATPVQDLDFQKLARLNVAGGNIRNIALNAAFLAAEEGRSVTMAHLLRATRGEYTKLEKSLMEAEIRGWVTG